MFLFRDLPLELNKEIRFALCAIYGVSFRKAFYIAAKVGLTYPFILKNINQYNFSIIFFLLKNLVISEVRIRRRVNFDITKLKDIECCRGKRHRLSLPVHGQRTRTNASTQRSKRIRMQSATDVIYNKFDHNKRKNQNKNQLQKKKR